MKPVIENERKRTKSKERGWLDVLADQFGGLTGDTVEKMKQRRKKQRDAG